MVLSNVDKKILYLSQAYCGSVHDYAMMKSEFNPNAGLWFDDQGVYVDLGFLGIRKNYQVKQLYIPHKKPRRKSKKDPEIELSEEQKSYNKMVNKIRIRVEHAISGLKRYRFLSDRLRYRNAQFYSRVAGIAAGL